MDSSTSTSEASTPTKKEEAKGQKIQHGMMALLRVNPLRKTYEIIECENEKKNNASSDDHSSSLENTNEQNQSIQKQMITISGDDTECEQIWEIQEELNTLDSFFNAHVAALKKQIETACQEFTVAQKKYKSMEKEYVNAKVDFLQKLEQKEQLQENLHTIIQQYEAHKAIKLHELEQFLRKFILNRDGKTKQEKHNVDGRRELPKQNSKSGETEQNNILNINASNQSKSESETDPRSQV